MPEKLSKRTISDFGEQWSRFTDNEGWYGSLALFQDMISPLLALDELRDKEVAEIGSGTGRIVAMLLLAGVRHVTAVEPSEAHEVLLQNLNLDAEAADRVTAVKARGDQFDPETPLDLVFCIGVLHHIPEPAPVVRAAFHALKPGGRFFVWLYGQEGNESYLRFLLPLRRLTVRLSPAILRALVELVYLALVVYRWTSRMIRLPLHDYIEEVLWPMTPAKRRLVIYDQLNPTYAKYYTQQEAGDLLLAAGFENVRLHHRHGYSWSAIGSKPETRDSRRT